jgi:adenylate kinase
MEVVLDEARSLLPQENVVELTSESTDDLNANVARLAECYELDKEQCWI